MLRNKRGAHFLEFTSTDKELVYTIRNLLGSNHKVGCKKKNTAWKPAYRIQIGSKEMFNDLQNLGLLPAKSLVLKFPDIPSSYFKDFVRGYFDGDGCISLGKYWRKDRSKWKWEITSRFTSGSREFLEKLWLSLKPYCSGGYICDKERGFELVFSRHDSVALSKLMYHNIPANLYLDRKYKKFQKAFKKLGYLGA